MTFNARSHSARSSGWKSTEFVFYNLMNYSVSRVKLTGRWINGDGMNFSLKVHTSLHCASASTNTSSEPHIISGNASGIQLTLPIKLSK